MSADAEASRQWVRQNIRPLEWRAAPMFSERPWIAEGILGNTYSARDNGLWDSAPERSGPLQEDMHAAQNTEDWRLSQALVDRVVMQILQKVAASGGALGVAGKQEMVLREGGSAWVECGDMAVRIDYNADGSVATKTYPHEEKFPRLLGAGAIAESNVTAQALRDFAGPKGHEQGTAEEQDGVDLASLPTPRM